MKLFMLGPVIVTLCILALFVKDHVGGKPERKPSGLPVIKPAPAFSLTERSGRTVTNADLLGKVWVAEFFFAECTGPCPTLTQRMQTIQNSMRHRKSDVRLVSFTLDPQRDTTLALRKYADRYGADPEMWWFLTGSSPSATEELVEKGFLTTVEPGGAGQIQHGTSLAVVDRRGQIRAFKNGMDADAVDVVLDHVEALLDEPDAP